MGQFGFFSGRDEKKKVQAEPAEAENQVRNPEDRMDKSDAEKAHLSEDQSSRPFQDAPVPAVVTFEERKKTSVPSEHGLYVAEILLLGYCSRYSYPKADGKYPEFWWTEYGIRDVDEALRSLEERGFLHMGSLKESVEKLSVFQIRKILKNHGQPLGGKKADLVKRVAETVSDRGLALAGVEQCYLLTDLGRQELDDNRYVLYMHEYPYTTSKKSSSGGAFNVWTLNRMLGDRDQAAGDGEEADASGGQKKTE